MKVREFKVHEVMDAPDVDPHRLRRALWFIRRVNAGLGYTRSTLRHLDRLTRDWPVGRTMRLLDVATGSGDVPNALLHWTRRRGIRAEIVGTDLHQTTLLHARNVTPVPLVRGDALQLPFADGSFDVVLSSMFLHHLPDDAVVQALREMDRVSSRLVLAADLVRSRRALVWITLLTTLSSDMIRHDARVSVRQAFTVREFGDLCRRAGLAYVAVHRHFGHRLVAAGRKP